MGKEGKEGEIFQTGQPKFTHEKKRPPLHGSHGSGYLQKKLKDWLHVSRLAANSTERGPENSHTGKRGKVPTKKGLGGGGTSTKAKKKKTRAGGSPYTGSGGDLRRIEVEWTLADWEWSKLTDG